MNRLGFRSRPVADASGAPVLRDQRPNRLPRAEASPIPQLEVELEVHRTQISPRAPSDDLRGSEASGTSCFGRSRQLCYFGRRRALARPTRRTADTNLPGGGRFVDGLRPHRRHGTGDGAPCHLLTTESGSPALGRFVSLSIRNEGSFRLVGDVVDRGVELAPHASGNGTREVRHGR